MTYILKDSSHKIEGQPPKKGVIWIPGKDTSVVFPTWDEQPYDSYFQLDRFWEGHGASVQV